ncbi:esterase E4-like isoform X2 [Nylanderia fulva]|uniref:esterase E4-like isoform X2 n=1 Tax=Nylanderia fulva TaxID=613905 RepID=UPI0010FB2BEA|nr:esterase E4-like isoform X2 [Nylanderia fulva]
MERPVVTVKQGKLQGIFEDNVLGSRYLAFKGIPFAAPPLGDLRFKDPEPPASWEGIRDASKNAGDVSVQLQTLPTLAIIGSEDCLYLNVYIPYNLYRTSRNPIMVWIHGGAYLMGNGNDTAVRPDYLMAKDVILVSINYRVGALGFLNIGHEVASGNQGLKDQVAALKWIKENIEIFGGDPNNITVFGVSAGSSSAHLLTLSPLSKGLFNKVILQSGIATCLWAQVEEAEASAFELASMLGNDSKDPVEVVNFLKTIPAHKIVGQQFQVLISEKSRITKIPFGPTIDEKAKEPFLPCPISQLLDDDSDIPIIVGYTSHEYIMFLNDISEEVLKTKFANLDPFIKVFTKDPEKITQLTEQVKQHYFHNKPITKESIPSIVQWMSDLYFCIPVNNFVNDQRKKKKAPIYLYNFSYVGNEMTSTKLMLNNDLPMIGASHTDDVTYLLYKPKCKVDNPKPPAIGTKDREVLEVLTKMWTNFAKTGNPTPIVDEHVTTIWLPATADSFNYLDIDSTPKLLTITDYNNILGDLELQESHSKY